MWLLKHSLFNSIWIYYHVSMWPFNAQKLSILNHWPWHVLKIFLTDCLQEFWFLFCFFFFPFQQLFYSSSPSFTCTAALNTNRAFAHMACEKLNIRNCREGKKELRKNSCNLLGLRSKTSRKNRREGYLADFLLSYWEPNRANAFEENTPKNGEWHYFKCTQHEGHTRHASSQRPSPLHASLVYLYPELFIWVWKVNFVFSALKLSAACRHVLYVT